MPRRDMVPKGSILVLLFQVLINDLAVLHVAMINLCAEDVARTMINAFLVLQSSSIFISGHPSLMPAADRTQLITVAILKINSSRQEVT